MIHTKPSSVSWNLFRVSDSAIRYWFQTVSVIQCWRWGVFCLQLHYSATQHILLEVPKPKITSNVTLSPIISTGTRDFRFSCIRTEVLLILWYWLPNFISIKNYTQNYIRPQAALNLGRLISMYIAAVTSCSQLDCLCILALFCWMSLVSNEVVFSRIQIFHITRFIIFAYFSHRFLFFSVIFSIFSCSRETI